MSKTPSVVMNYGESWPPVMDFSARLKPGETITGVASVVASPTTSPALTIGSITNTTDQVQFTTTAGVAGTKYTITVTVATTQGTRIGVGYLQLQSET